MEAQNEIKRTLKQQTSIEVIRGMLAQQEHHSRSSLAESVCQHFGFFDARRRTQTAGCVKALRELELAGHIVLPAALDRGRCGAKSPRRLGEPVEAAHDVPDQVNDVRGLTLIKVDNLAQMRVWNELMIREHPQGAGPLVGAQMRYLIGSEHGWLRGSEVEICVISALRAEHLARWL